MSTSLSSPPPVAMAESNPFDALTSSPVALDADMDMISHEEAKESEPINRRYGKDDMKEQAYQAREQIKGKATQLKEQIVESDIFEQGSTKLQQGIDMAKEKAADLQAAMPSMKKDAAPSNIERDTKIKAAGIKEQATSKAIDLKDQAAAKGAELKSKAIDLKDQIAKTDIIGQASDAIQQGIDTVKGKAADLAPSSKDAPIKQQSNKQSPPQKMKHFKAQITDAKDQIVNSDIIASASSTIQDGIETIKSKANDLTSKDESAPIKSSKKNSPQIKSKDLKSKAADLKQQASDVIDQGVSAAKEQIDTVKEKAVDIKEKNIPSKKEASIKSNELKQDVSIKAAGMKEQAISKATDLKEQATAKATEFQSKAMDLKDQLVNADIVGQASSAIQQGIDTVKGKAADLAPSSSKETPIKKAGGKSPAQKMKHFKAQVVDAKDQLASSDIIASASNTIQDGIETIKSKAASLAPSKEELAEDNELEQPEPGAGASAKDVKGMLNDFAADTTEMTADLKQRGAKQMKKAAGMLDAKLSGSQKAKLEKGVAQAKEMKARTSSWIDSTLSAPMLRPVRTFIRKNNLQLPVTIFLSLIGLWMSLTVIRLITTHSAPSMPEFDIHSKDASIDWLRYHSGELKDKAIDMKSSLTGRAATFLANNQYDTLKTKAIDYRDIGMSKLGLSEPTWGEWAWAKLTGRPITWQERVDSILSLAKAGVAARAADLAKDGVVHGIKSAVGVVHKEATMAQRAAAMLNRLRSTVSHEPTMTERASGAVDSLRSNMPSTAPVAGWIDGVKSTIFDTAYTIRSYLPGGEPLEVIKQRAYDAAHPSTLNQMKSGAEYIKNRVLHGAQEAAHIAQDRANELADKAKYKTGL